MSIDKIVCYIFNNIIVSITHQTLGNGFHKQEKVSLNEFIVGILLVFMILILISWWLIPLKYISKEWDNYSKDIIFTCKKQ